MTLSVNVEAEFLAAVLQGHTLESDLLEKADFGYFNIESYKWLVKQLKARNWQPIAFNFLDQILLEDIKENEKRELYRQQIYQLYTLQLTFVDDAQAKFKDFIAHSIIKSTMKDAFEAHDRSKRTDYFLKDIESSVKEAKNLLGEDSLQVVDWASDYDKRIAQRLQEREQPDLSPRVLTGIKGLDDQFTIKPGMIVDFLAPFKRYKSIILNNMAFAALLQGFNVLHIVFENTIELTNDRYDSLVSEISLDRMLNLYLDQNEMNNLNNLAHWMGRWDARLKVIKCRAYDTNLEQVAERLDRLRVTEGFVPQVVVLDYLNIVAPVKSHVKEERSQQREVVWDAKAFVDRYNIPMFTATQANMEGNNVERLENKHRGKSIDISQGVNLSIAINQTEQEADEGRLVLSPLFSRERKIQGEVVVNTAFERMAIQRDSKALWEIAMKRFGNV